ncbi:hypothetical protein B566_EDAN003783 [Ephemera danica]|nr:hypothetical protein B566_EDAN003783 [Ephemera danica]
MITTSDQLVFGCVYELCIFYKSNMHTFYSSILLAILCALTAVNGGDVKGGIYDMIGGKEYFISDDAEQVTQADAVMKCQDLGMQLLSIETSSENSLIIDYCMSHDCYFRFVWTSGVRSGSSDWVWSSTGAQATYFQWLYGQPDLLPAETAIVTYPQIGWFDVDPTTLYNNYICEHPE